MRGLALGTWLAMTASGCAPKVSVPPSFDEDLPRTEAAAPAPAARSGLAVEAPRPIAPAGKGARTGTIARARLNAVLDAGPAAFLRQIEVAPRLAGERFIGWELVQLVDRGSPLADVDLVPGDVLLAVNGKQLSRPDQLQVLWDALRSANAVHAQLWRGDDQLVIEFAIEPPATR